MNNKKKSTFVDSLPVAFKGIIGVMLTILVVIVITMLFAKSLFISNTSGQAKKTGKMTRTEYVSVATTTTTTESKSTTTTTTDDEYEDPYQTGDIFGDTTEMKVISAVYLHPEPTSKSENLMVIPVGATVKVFKNENGWLYLDYNGNIGYAYETFFE